MPQIILDTPCLGREKSLGADLRTCPGRPRGPNCRFQNIPPVSSFSRSSFDWFLFAPHSSRPSILSSSEPHPRPPATIHRSACHSMRSPIIRKSPNCLTIVFSFHFFSILFLHFSKIVSNDWKFFSNYLKMMLPLTSYQIVLLQLFFPSSLCIVDDALCITLRPPYHALSESAMCLPKVRSFPPPASPHVPCPLLSCFSFSPLPHPILLPSTGYKRLDAYILANLVQLETLAFWRRHLPQDDDPCGRQFDQMTQAARSGVKNITEGCERIATSSQTALRLLDVAKASLCELRDDYLTFLVDRGVPPWRADLQETKRVFGGYGAPNVQGGTADLKNSIAIECNRRPSIAVEKSGKAG